MNMEGKCCMDLVSSLCNKDVAAIASNIAILRSRVPSFLNQSTDSIAPDYKSRLSRILRFKNLGF